MSYNQGNNNPRYLHGFSATPTYKVWGDMMQRCNNPKSSAYKYYGGRGISVCRRWHIFTNFYEDMGVRPVGMTLERINNNDGYNLSNCVWATMREQSQNKRAGGHKILTPEIVVEIRASTDKQAALAHKYGVAQTTISDIKRRKTWKSI